MTDREFVDGAFYWVRRPDDGEWDIAQWKADCFVSAEGGFYETGWDCAEPRETYEEIGPCLGKEPMPSSPHSRPDWTSLSFKRGGADFHPSLGDGEIRFIVTDVDHATGRVTLEVVDEPARGLVR